jgi:hypothetical protein
VVAAALLLRLRSRLARSQRRVLIDHPRPARQ